MCTPFGPFAIVPEQGLACQDLGSRRGAVRMEITMAAKLAGGGKGRYELGQNADINVTPFVDVMLVLLIIFMVAAPMATTSIRIDLPPAGNSVKDQKKPTFLSIRRGGEVYVIPDGGGVQKVSDLDHLT